ncbi:MAG: beta-propeller domain-containing protein [Ruminiclostridium sp.]
MKKPILTCSILLLSIIVLTSMMAPASGQSSTLLGQADITTTQNLLGSQLYLHIGSPLILSQGEISSLDPENLDVSATIINNRTLVPLRALSEYFKAEVSYDSAGRKAIIAFNGKRYFFPIGESKYIQTDGTAQKENSIDTKTMILNDRTMVPLRIICEDILGLKVSYYDKIIAISDRKIDLQGNNALVTDVKLKIGSALKAQSIDQLKSAIMGQNNLNGDVIRFSGDIAAETSNSIGNVGSTSDTTSTPANNSIKLKSETATDYSTTNTQVQGIDEADIVKTDGAYIYIAGNNAVRIVSTDKGNLEDTAAIRVSENKTVSEIYIEGDRLVLMGMMFEQSETTPSQRKDAVPEVDAATKSKRLLPNQSKNYSFIDIYDISDRKSPVLVKEHNMQGNYQSSRKNGSIVYLITNTYAYNDTVVPMMRDTIANEKSYPLPLKDIMIMPGYPTSGYVVVSAVNINDNQKAQVEAITTFGHLIYMNNSALYLVANGYDGQSTITKFTINGMNIGYAGSGKVKGYILNQFSMDEYNGYFRVATTWNNENNLFILDKSLNICGSVTGLAKGEQIYSVRFMGDKGYIVTFRTMDPLFVFDLSDPKNPKVTGELKIPGFSNYLHPIGENLLLGIGQDTYDIFKKDSSGKDVVVGTRQGGIKLSLFDVSDMGKPKEISNYILGDLGSYTDVFYDHRAAMFDSASNNVVFDASITDTSGKYKHGAAIFNFGNNSIKLKGVVDYIQPEVSGLYIPYGRRAIYIGDELYYIQDGIVSSYNYKTLAPIDTLILK